MKFLCPSCKAKYQIADEKVAGRSVRMKCRKCGHVIQVSSIAGVGDALLGSEPPSAIDAASDASAAQASSLPPVAPKTEAKSEPKAASKAEAKPELRRPPASPTRPSAAKPAPAAKGP